MFGTPKQPIDLDFDTQTDWTIVLSTECKDCGTHTQRYDRIASSSYNESKDIQIKSIPFGDGGTLIGQTSVDIACMVLADQSEVCLDNKHTFFEVTGFQHLSLSSSYSGIIGLAPDDPANGPSFIAKLKNEGKITEKKIGMQINRAPAKSYVTIGGVSEAMMYEIDG